MTRRRGPDPWPERIALVNATLARLVAQHGVDMKPPFHFHYTTVAAAARLSVGAVGRVGRHHADKLAAGVTYSRGWFDVRNARELAALSVFRAATSRFFQ